MRIDSLDGVRALLALWVVFGHLTGPVGVHVPLLGNPAVAVDLFMVLSGFFIASTYESLSREHPPATAMRYFWIRRVLRIWPVYAVLLTLVWLFLEPLNRLMMEQVSSSRGYPEVTLFSALLHYTMLFGVLPSQATATPLPDWSLSLEFQFYLLFPLLAIALRRWPLWLCFGAAVLAFVSPPLLGHYLEPGRFGHFRQPAFLPYRLNFFLIGCLAYMTFKPGRDALPWTTQLLAVVLCVAVSGAQATLGVFGILYLLAQPHGRAAQLLGTPTMRWLGRISFSVYLVHAPLMRVVAGLLRQESWFMGLPALARYAVAAACLLPLVLATAHLLYVLVERPGIRLAHRWTQRREPSLPASAFVAGGERAARG